MYSSSLTLFIGIIHETLPEAQRTQCIWSIYNSNHFSYWNHFDIILTKREDKIYLLWYQLRKHGKANVKRKVLIFGRGPSLRRLLSSLIHCHCYSSPPSCQPTCVYPIDWNALLALSLSIELVSSSARVTSVKSAQRSCTHSVRDTRTHRSDPRYTWVRYLCNHFWLGVSVNIVIIWPDPTPMGYSFEHNPFKLRFGKLCVNLSAIYLLWWYYIYQLECSSHQNPTTLSLLWLC